VVGTTVTRLVVEVANKEVEEFSLIPNTEARHAPLELRPKLATFRIVPLIVYWTFGLNGLNVIRLVVEDLNPDPELLSLFHFSEERNAKSHLKFKIATPNPAPLTVL